MTTQKGKFTTWLRESITARMIIVGFLIAVLLVPLSFVKSLIYERTARQQEVVREINSKWGNEVVLSGPILKVPYKTYKEEQVFDQTNKTYSTVRSDVWHTAYFFPKTLDIDSEVTTMPLKRSIYESVVFKAQIALKGTFEGFDFSSMNIPEQDVSWDKAKIIMQTTNLKGIKNTVQINFNDSVLELSPKYNQDYLNTLQSASILDLGTYKDQIISFNLSLKINGSESLKFIPLGKQTTASMTSNWPDPSFSGNFLPNDETKEISETGFKADWSVLQINRQFEQQFFDRLPDLTGFSFGTNLVIPVDQYLQSERSSKYGFLVIGLTLFVFLMIQIVSKIYIHPFQYMLIGLALVLFYTLLVAISEHQAFSIAYLIAASSVVALITLFAKALLKRAKFTALILGSLTALYGFIYIIIQLENYALLVGSIGLFTILAIIMFVSRKIDWSNEN